MFDITNKSAINFAQFKRYYMLDIDTKEKYTTKEFMAAVKAVMNGKSYHVVEEDDVDFEGLSYSPLVLTTQKMYLDNRWMNSCASCIAKGTWQLLNLNKEDAVVGEGIQLLCITVADAFVCYLAEVGGFKNEAV